MDMLIKEAVNQLETLLSSELIKFDSLEDQLTLINQMILKLVKYRDRITYRVVDVTSPVDISLEDPITVDENSPADAHQLINILVTPKSLVEDFDTYPDDPIETNTYENTIENNSKTVSVVITNPETSEFKNNDNLHENVIKSDIFVDQKDNEYVSVVEESIIFMNKEISGEEHFVEERIIHQQKDLQNPLTNVEKEIDWLMYYQRNKTGFVCKICEKILKGSSQMKEHIRDNHGVGGTLLQCQYKGCDYSTLSGSKFRAHKSWHSNNAALICPVCKKEYLGGSKGLRNHMKIHSKSRDYICESCNKSFINLSRLNFHIQNVHGDQTYLCEFCNHQFKSKANFMRHQLTHSSQKPFTCHYCPFSTTGSTSLTSHVRNVHREFDFTAGKANKLKKKVDRIRTTPSNNITVNMPTVLNQQRKITKCHKSKGAL